MSDEVDTAPPPDPSNDVEFRKRLERGAEALRAGLADEARIALERAVQLKPQSQAAQELLAMTYLNLGHLDGAEVLYRALVEDNPNDADRNVNLGVVLLELGRSGEALDSLLAAVQIAPHHVKAANTLGTAYTRTGDLRRARQWFERAGNQDMVERISTEQTEQDSNADSTASVGEFQPASTSSTTVERTGTGEFLTAPRFRPIVSEPRGSTDPGIVRKLMLAPAEPPPEVPTEAPAPEAQQIDIPEDDGTTSTSAGPISLPPAEASTPSIPPRSRATPPQALSVPPVAAPLAPTPPVITPLAPTPPTAGTGPISIPAAMLKPKRGPAFAIGLALVALAAVGAGVSYFQSREKPSGAFGRAPMNPGGCVTGLETSADTVNHCCWPGQAWGRDKCLGIPTTCPSGWTADAHLQACLPPGCTDGRIPAEDGTHCCWADQIWSANRKRCVGVPSCPAGFSVEGENCVETKKPAAPAAASGAPAVTPDTVAPPPEANTTALLPDGVFQYGCEPQDRKCFDDEIPGDIVKVKSFRIQKTEVSVEDWQMCVIAGVCTLPAKGGGCNWGMQGRDRHPINCVDWYQAKAYCGWVHGRMLTAQEWEFAAKGGKDHIYPWGNKAPEKRWANFSSTGTEPVGSHPDGATPQGVFDMAGNLWEWTASNYDPATKELRGGSWVNDARNLRASVRYRVAASTRADNIGVRCGF